MLENKIDIVHETSDFLVADKPAGLSVHNHEGKDLLSLLQDQTKLAKLYAVHRLDQQTSGLILLAKNPVYCAQASQVLSQGGFTKIYYALVRRPQGKTLAAHGEWRQEMTNKAEGGKNRRGLSSRRVACHSEYWLEKSGARFDLLRLFPHTGRKHQLRRHCAVNGFPILGDQRYGGKREVWKDYSRICLHAARLEIPAIADYDEASFFRPPSCDFYPSDSICEEFSPFFAGTKS